MLCSSVYLDVILRISLPCSSTHWPQMPSSWAILRTVTARARSIAHYPTLSGSPGTSPQRYIHCRICGRVYVGYTSIMHSLPGCAFRSKQTVMTVLFVTVPVQVGTSPPTLWKFPCCLWSTWELYTVGTIGLVVVFTQCWIFYSDQLKLNAKFCVLVVVCRWASCLQCHHIMKAYI